MSTGTIRVLVVKKNNQNNSSSGLEKSDSPGLCTGAISIFKY